MDLKLSSMLKTRSTYAKKKSVQIFLSKQPTVGHEFKWYKIDYTLPLWYSLYMYNLYSRGYIYSKILERKLYRKLKWNSKKQDIRKEKPSNRQYDWTYQTSYKGSIRGEKSVKSDPGALCDLENLKKRETIGWYRDIRLYDGIILIQRFLKEIFIV